MCLVLGLYQVQPPFRRHELAFSDTEGPDSGLVDAELMLLATWMLTHFYVVGLSSKNTVLQQHTEFKGDLETNGKKKGQSIPDS